ECFGYAVDTGSGAWLHEGLFGAYDRAAALRGLPVLREVCAACHWLTLVSFRTLADLGFSEDEVKAIAAEYEFTDGPDDFGDMFDRPGKASDKFPSPFPNEQAALAGNGGAFPGGLSLVRQARPGGANHVCLHPTRAGGGAA